MLNKSTSNVFFWEHLRGTFNQTFIRGMSRLCLMSNPFLMTYKFLYIMKYWWDKMVLQLSLVRNKRFNELNYKYFCLKLILSSIKRNRVFNRICIYESFFSDTVIERKKERERGGVIERWILHKFSVLSFNMNI